MMNWDRVRDDGRMIIGGDRDRFLSVRFYYSRGTGFGDRGYYLSVTPVRRVSRVGYSFLECCPSDGKRVFLKSVSRRSAKTDKEAGAIVDMVLDGLINDVCVKNGIDRADLGELIAG